MKRKLSWMHMAGLVVLVASLALPAFAQAGRGKGRLKGVVVDDAGNPLADVRVRMEFEKDGLKDETITNKKGEWNFIGLGTGGVTLYASATGYLDAMTQVRVQQLEPNPPVTLTLRVDREKKARLKDETSLQALDQGTALFNERKFAEALAVFEKFAAENPTVFQIHFNIGDCHRESGDFDKAAAEYNLALAAARDAADTIMQAKGLSALGELFLRQDKFKEAQELFKQSIALSPKDEVLAYNVAEICFANNKSDEALQYYQLAAQIKPDWSEPHVKVGYVWLNKGDIAKAIDSFNMFLKLAPQSDQAPAIQALVDSLNKAK